MAPALPSTTKTSKALKEIKLRLHATDLYRIDAQAAASGISRSELIRNQLSADPRKKAHNLTPDCFYSLVAAARKRTGNCVPPRQIESIVTAVLVELA